LGGGADLEALEQLHADVGGDVGAIKIAIAHHRGDGVVVGDRYGIIALVATTGKAQAVVHHGAGLEDLLEVIVIVDIPDVRFVVDVVLAVQDTIAIVTGTIRIGGGVVLTVLVGDTTHLILAGEQTRILLVIIQFHPVFVHQLAIGVCQIRVKVSLVHIADIEEVGGGEGGAEVDGYGAALAALAEQLDDAVGTLGTVDRGGGSTLNDFDALNVRQVEGLEVRTAYFDAVQEDQRLGTVLDRVDTTKGDVDRVTGVTGTGLDLRTSDLTDQRLIYGGRRCLGQLGSRDGFH